MFLSLVKNQDSKLKDTVKVHIYFVLPKFFQSILCYDIENCVASIRFEL